MNISIFRPSKENKIDLLQCFCSCMTTCTCLILTVLKVKTVPLEFGTEDTVLPEQRFVGLHTLMCHAERENIKKYRLHY